MIRPVIVMHFPSLLSPFPHPRLPRLTSYTQLIPLRTNFHLLKTANIPPADFVRLSYGPRLEVLVKGMAAIQRIVAKHTGRQFPKRPSTQQPSQPSSPTTNRARRVSAAVDIMGGV